MKTISESSQEYTTKDSLYIIDGEYVDKTIEDAFAAGVEFAQRWISVEEELPSPIVGGVSEMVIGYAKYPDNTHDYVLCVYNSESGIWSSSYELIVPVAKWRPINYK